MKKIAKILIPIKLHLTILQLEEYKYSRFISWISKNFFKRSIPTKKSLVITPKIKYLTILYIFICLSLSTISLLITNSIIFLFITLVILSTQTYLTLGLALLLLRPYEIYNKRKTIENTKNKVLSIKNLKVVAVTGSFGKSSTKEILYQLLKEKYNILKTPESFNTIFGIAKVVDLELDKNYDYFICEMAAYQKGEITTLCYMVPPQYGILTGITTQHFERFGSLENTVQAKFELVDAIKDKNNIIFNLDDKNITNELKKRRVDKPTGFLNAQNIKFDKTGSSFDLLFGDKKYHIKTALFGSANVKNILAAASMAQKLGLDLDYIIKRVNFLTPIDNRFVLTKTEGKAVIVNNTYSSNPKGFIETIKTANMVRGKKVIITPGLVELGEREREIHIEIGQKAKGVFDKVFLVGKNNRTQSLAEGLEEKENIEFISDNREDYFNTINSLKNKFDWIFLENDVTQNY